MMEDFAASSPDDASSQNTLFSELFDYLNSNRQDIQEEALKYILQYSHDDAFVEFAALYVDRTAKPLMKHIGSSRNMSRKAIQSLINLSRSETIATALVRMHCVKLLMENLMDQIVNEAPRHESFNLMLLTNLTRLPVGQRELLQVNDTLGIEGLYLTRLVLNFLKESPQKLMDLYGEDAYLWVAHILVNITTIEEGRSFLVKKDRALINLISHQLNHKIRRGILLGCFRHLCYSVVHHPYLILPDCEVLPKLLSLVYCPLPLKDREIKYLDDNNDITSSFFTAKDSCATDVQLRLLWSSYAYLSKDSGNANSESANTEATDYRHSIRRHLFEGRLSSLHPTVQRASSKEEFLSMDRKALSECIEGLCLSKVGRDALRDAGIYEVLSCWYTQEADDGIKEEVDRLAHVIQFPEEITVNKLIQLSNDKH